MASLAHASRMATRFGARNIDFKQGVIEEISKLPEYALRFAMIECGGVLHHMAVHCRVGARWSNV
jgi:hypothetical protein